MCIIIAKNAGIPMPSTEILHNCFDNNPDGAGFMLAAKNSVYGFKGLMTFEEFTDELARAEKRFGKLDKLPVVLHFRITTHGSSVAGNTHPFPLKGGYREMRKTQWCADQGFAHNGIIHQTSYDPDIKKHKVSDTMVFAKKYIVPIAKYASIASDPAILDMLYEVADSKLCFLDKKGKIATRGDFIEQNGVLYSNTSFREEHKASKSVYCYDFRNYYDYYKDYISIDKRKNDSIYLSRSELADYRDELAESMEMYELPFGTEVHFVDNSYTFANEEDMLYIDLNDDIYRFDEEHLDFILYAAYDEYVTIIFPEEDDSDV